MLTIGDFARLGQVSPRMLRHYDEIGLLRPERVDRASGYRYYSIQQLERLHGLVALRDLGFKLDEVGAILDEELAVDEIRGMLRARRAQIEATVEDERARLRRVEARLRALERSDAVDITDAIIKHTEPIRVADAPGAADGFGNENLGPLFAELVPMVFDDLVRAGVQPGISVARYEEYLDDAPYVVRIGFDIGSQEFEPTERVQVVELPVERVASVVHRGSVATIAATFEGLARWIDDAGHVMTGTSRELYHEWHDEDVTQNVTELQLLIAD